MDKPNIVFILADDMGEWAMGCSGNSDIKTPNIDRLADSGMRFENFFCVSPVCSPARASIITGKIPSQHGVHDWIRGGNAHGSVLEEAFKPVIKDYKSNDVPIQYLEDHKAYTEVLDEVGYECALSGKWHLGDSLTPQKCFKHWYTIGKGGCHYIQPDVVEDGKLTVRSEYITDLITEDALKYLDGRKDDNDPFYLSVHYTAPHSPWEHEEHPKEFVDLYKDCDFTATPDLPVHEKQIKSAPYGTGERRKYLLAGYYAAISAMDKCIGDIINKLEETGKIDNTLIIFTGDNGMNMGHHGIWGKGNGTFPLNMFDTSVKVPMIVSWKGYVEQGKVCDRMLSHYDVYPTLLDIVDAGCDREDLPGKSYKKILCGEDTSSDDDKVVIFDEYGSTRMIRTRKYKYVHRFPYGPHEFYDLEKDPNEYVNLIDDVSYEDKVVELRTQLIEWFVKYTDVRYDGTKEAVYGVGQRTKISTFSDNVKPFFDEFEYGK